MRTITAGALHCLTRHHTRVLHNHRCVSGSYQIRIFRTVDVSEAGIGQREADVALPGGEDVAQDEALGGGQAHGELVSAK